MPQLLAYKRYPFKGMMYLPLEDPSSQSNIPILTYIKDVEFDFASDPSTPRSVILCEEPLPQSAVISAVVDQFDVQPLPGAEYTITTVEPLINVFGQRDLYRHQAALRAPLDFGYEGIVRG